jgi:hypothetical protein
VKPGSAQGLFDYLRQIRKLMAIGSISRRSMRENKYSLKATLLTTCSFCVLDGRSDTFSLRMAAAKS